MGRRRRDAWVVIVAGLLAAAAARAPAGEIHAAAASGDAAKLRRLLAGSPRLARAVDCVGRTPLHYAARSGGAEAAQALLASGADVSSRDAAGWTPLHVAAAAGQKEVAELLISKAAEVDARDVRGHTPLHLAVSCNRRSTAELLITRGAAASVGVPGPGEIERLVKQLGDESWQKRNDAHVRLIKFGFFALDAAKAAASSDDNEIAWRAKEIAAKLEKVSGQRIIPCDFWVVGPFAHRDGKEPLETVYPPEAALAAGKVDLHAAYKEGEGKEKRELAWSRPWPGEENSVVDLDAPWKDQTNAVAYALTWVFCPEKRGLVMLLGSDDSVKVWIGKKLVHTNDVRRPVRVDQDRVETFLAAGWNRLAVKVVEYAGEWGFSVRFVDAEGVQPVDVIFDPTRGGEVKLPAPEPKPKPKPEPEAKDAPGERSGEKPAPAGARQIIRIDLGGPPR